MVRLICLKGLIWMRGVPDLLEQDLSAWEGVPDLPEQDLFSYLRILGTSSSLINPPQAIRQSGKLLRSGKTQRLKNFSLISPFNALNFFRAYFLLKWFFSS